MRVKLDKVCKRIYAGGDVPKGRYSTVKTAEYAIPIYANAEKDNGLYGYTDTARENELSITVAARGTIGFTAIRREPFLPVVRLITVVPDLSTVSERYLYYALRNCKPAFSGTSIPQLTVPDIKKNEIELYSLSVQETIADKLDAVGRIIELRQQQLQKLDDLVKARFVELFGSVDDNQKDIKTIRVGDACTLINGRAFKPDEWSTEGLPIVRIQNLNSEEAPFNYYSGEVKSQHLINSGDLLFSWSGTPGTSFGAFFWRRGKAALNQHIFKVIPNCDYNLFFLQYALNERLNFIISRAHGGVGLQHITKKELDEVLLFQPGINEQNDFATFVEQVDKSKAAVQKSLDEAQILFDSLMQQYFG